MPQLVQGVSVLEKLGLYAVPAVVLIIVVYGGFRRVRVFDCFAEGVKEGFSALLSVAPSLVGLIVGVTMLEASGFFGMLTWAVSPVCEAVGIPAQVVPLGLMRPVTGSGSFAILNSILENCGPDSVTGRIASVMTGSTETTFYAITVYYGAVNLKSTRYTLPAAVTADLVGMLSAVWLIRAFG